MALNLPTPNAEEKLAGFDPIALLDSIVNRVKELLPQDTYYTPGGVTPQGPQPRTNELGTSIEFSSAKELQAAIDSGMTLPESKNFTPAHQSQYLADLGSKIQEVAGRTTIEAQNAIDVGALLPEQSPAVVKQGLVDSAVANSVASSVVGEIPTSQPVYLGAESGTIGSKGATASLPGAPKETLSERAKHMLQSFQSAFPDKTFTVTEKDGMITVEDQPNQTSSSVVSRVPLGYNAERAAAGLADMQTALAKETDPKRQLELAYGLKSAVATQQAAKYQMYVNQADAEAQIPDLIQAVAQSRQLDSMHPAVRASGMMSKQTAELMAALSAARVHSAARVKNLMDTDPILSQAYTIADVTIKKIEHGSILENRLDASDQRSIKIAERNAQILDVKSNPTMLDRVSLLKTGRPLTPGTEDVLAQQIVDRKIHLDPVEQALVGLPAEQLRQFYLGAPDQKTRERALQVMIHEEAKVYRDKDPKPGAVALDHVKVFKQIMDTPMTDPKVPAQIRKDFTDGMNAAKQFTGAEKTKREAEVSNLAHLAYVDVFVKAQAQSDVRVWDGLIKSDPTAKAVLKQADETQPGKPLPMKMFITNYLNYGDNVSKADKISQLRSIVGSYVDAMPDSVIFPKPSAESFKAEIDKQVAHSLLSQLGGIAQFMPQFGPSGLVTQGLAIYANANK